MCSGFWVKNIKYVHIILKEFSWLQNMIWLTNQPYLHQDSRKIPQWSKRHPVSRLLILFPLQLTQPELERKPARASPRKTHRLWPLSPNYRLSVFPLSPSLSLLSRGRARILPPSRPPSRKRAFCLVMCRFQRIGNLKYNSLKRIKFISMKEGQRVRVMTPQESESDH